MEVVKVNQAALTAESANKLKIYTDQKQMEKDEKDKLESNKIGKFKENIENSIYRTKERD